MVLNADQNMNVYKISAKVNKKSGKTKPILE